MTQIYHVSCEMSTAFQHSLMAAAPSLFLLGLVIIGRYAIHHIICAPAFFFNMFLCMLKYISLLYLTKADIGFRMNKIIRNQVSKTRALIQNIRCDPGNVGTYNGQCDQPCFVIRVSGNTVPIRLPGQPNLCAL